MAVPLIGLAACERAIPTAPTPELEPSLNVVGAPSVRLTYMCGNRFRVRNEGLREARLRYDVYRTSEQASLTVLGREPTTAFEEYFFETNLRGTVRLFDGVSGRLLSTKANGGTTCSTPRTYTVTVRVHPGVDGFPASGTYTVPVGTSFAWAYSVQAGFDSIAVESEYAELGTSGAFPVRRGRIIDVFARPIPAVERPEAAAAFAAFRALYSPGTPVQAAWRAFVWEYGKLADAIGADAAGEQADLMSREIGQSLAMIQRQIVLEDSISTLDEPPNGGLSAMRQFAAGAPREPVRAIYINGINTDFPSFVSTIARFTAILRDSIGHPLRDRAVVGVYSRTQPPPPGAAKLLWDCTWYSIRRSWTPARALRAIESRCGVTGQLPDLLEAAIQRISARDPLFLPEDAVKLQQAIAVRLRQGEQVVLLAHSQGALMARQALARLDSDSLLNLRRDSTDVALLTIGAPQRTLFPEHMSSGRLRHVIARCDGVAALESSLSEGELTVVEPVPPCAFSIPSALSFRDFVSDLMRLNYFFVEAHSINGQYLAFPRSRAAILADARQLTRELVAGSFDLQIPEIGIGRSISISEQVRVVNAVQTRYLERRKPRVTSERSEIAEIVGDSVIVGRSLGATNITASLWDVEGTGVVDVVPPPPPAVLAWGNFPSPSIASLVVRGSTPIASVTASLGTSSATVIRASDSQWLVQVPLSERTPTGSNCANESGTGLPVFAMRVPGVTVSVQFTNGTGYGATVPSPGFAVFTCGFFFDDFRGYRSVFP